jgi:hypothetical protein
MLFHPTLHVLTKMTGVAIRKLMKFVQSNKNANHRLGIVVYTAIDVQTKSGTRCPDSACPIGMTNPLYKEAYHGSEN